MAEKSRDAFRTISEVADWLDVPTHVLRFWESRFSQIKPVKRAGGRRYYRPSDMRVIGGVKVLLHDQGMTIRGVQKLFREEGIKHVSGYAPELFGEDLAEEPTTPLNEEALELAARPAPAARSTHDAAPDPDVIAAADDEAAQVEVENTVEAETAEAAETPEPADTSEPDSVPTPVFRSRAAPAAPAGEDPAAEDPTPELPLVEDAAASKEAPAIPATPDVPDSDPADDDANHVVPAGVAARLRLADPDTLIAHRDALMAAAEQLRAIANRAD